LILMIFRTASLKFLLATLVLALTSVSACSGTEEYPTTQTQSACGVECALYDEDCVDKAMHECLL